MVASELDVQDAVRLILQAGCLKDLPRSGWVTSGTCAGQRPEGVAAHIWGTTLVALIIGRHLESTGVDVDLARALAMCTVHDLPESLLSDIPRTGIEGVDRAVHDTKAACEGAVLEHLVSGLGATGEWVRRLWEDLSVGESAEAKIVRDADVIDMLARLVALRRSGVAEECLRGFVNSAARHQWAYDISADIAAELCRTLAGHSMDGDCTRRPD